MAREVPFLVAAILAAVSLVNAATGCYYPNGTNANADSDKYKPCPSPGRNHSMCCYESGEQRCQENGLCYYSDRALLWRQLCTDSTWESEDCVKLCISGEARIAAPPDVNLYDMANIQVRIKTCDDGSLCCGDESSELAKSCCSKGEGIWLDEKGQLMLTNPSSSQSATTSETSSTAAPTSSGVTSNPNSKSNTGTIVGAVVGVVGGLALVVGAVLFVLRRRKRAANIDGKKGLLEENNLHIKDYPSPPLQGTTRNSYGAAVAELSNVETVEMGVTSPAQRSPNELPA